MGQHKFEDSLQSSGALLTLVKIKSEDLPYFKDYDSTQFDNFDLKTHIDLKIVGNDNTRTVTVHSIMVDSTNKECDIYLKVEPELMEPMSVRFTIKNQEIQGGSNQEVDISAANL